MTLHLVLHFLHVVGALGVCAALGVEIAALVGLRRAAPDDVRRSIALFDVNRRLGPPALACIVVPGAALTSISWGWKAAWVHVSFGALVAIVIIGAAITGRRIQRLERELGDREAVRTEQDRVDLARLAEDPVLVASLLARCGLVLGVVFVMTTKPEPMVALGALVSGASLGLLPLLGRSATA
jgi:hypothetical protein